MSLDSIMNIMGGAQNIGRDIHTRLDFIKASREGAVSIAVVKSIQNKIHLTNKMMSSILEISESTLQRHIKEDRKLKKAESETAYEVSKVIAKGIEVFEDENDFNEWLYTKNTALGEERPIDWLDSSIGREQLLDLLVSIEHGMYS
ncbi:type II RES/Xre toxin-antitoxin system antitoxin [Adhaeribacter radiodurans]|nr:antitoxin Xre/MbcA/ParS toxin-binding domain-containing protein [Adhaeribacter radiodurans]